MIPRVSPFRLPAALCSAIWLTLGSATRVAARAGGAGGHSGSGGSHGSSSHGNSSFGSSSYHGAGGSYGGESYGGGTWMMYVFLFFLVCIALGIYQTFSHQSASTRTPVTPETDDESSSLRQFCANHPDFDLTAFTIKVRCAFQKIQAAWSAQSLAEIRPFITDGMYQRFSTQFRMMGLLKQQNYLDQIQILRVEPRSARSDGAYDVIDVLVEATIHDAFICDLDHSLDSQSEDTFVEYWSFIRKRNLTKFDCDIFDDTNCPSCGAPLPKDMGELCRCAYCQVMVNSGQFDWVLAEITQPPDSSPASRITTLATPDLPAAIARIAPECADFSTQLAEDKASNAFMQIMTAIATRNPAAVRRFVADEVLAQVTARITARNLVFNRIYLNEAVLLNAARVGTRHQLAIGLSATMQQIEVLADNRLVAIDSAAICSDHVLVMERDADAMPQQGLLYQHQCANCGGAVGDTLDLACPYCGARLNSTRNEWIVTEWITPTQYACNANATVLAQ